VPPFPAYAYQSLTRQRPCPVYFSPATFISSWGTGGAGAYNLNNSGTVTGSETVTAVTGGVGSTGVNGFGWIAFDTVSNVAQGI